MDFVRDTVSARMVDKCRSIQYCFYLRRIVNDVFFTGDHKMIAKIVLRESPLSLQTFEIIKPILQRSVIILSLFN